MMNEPPPNLEPTAVLTLIISGLVGPSVAAVIGPYAVIVIAALAGASWALSDETATTTGSALWFLARITVTAAVLTSVIVAGLERYVIADPGTARWLIAPVAFGIGWVGHDWPRLLTYLTRTVKRRFGDSIKRGGGNGRH